MTTKNLTKISGMLLLFFFVNIVSEAAPPYFDTLQTQRMLNSVIFLSEGENFSFTIQAYDPDGDQLTYSASGLPPWADFDTDTHTLYGQAGYWSDIDSIRETQRGAFDVEISVSDGEYTVKKIITIELVDSLWGNKTITELLDERPVESGDEIKTPVQIDIISIDTVTVPYAGGKDIRKITFSFRSQTPTLDSCANDWVSDLNFAFLPLSAPAVDNCGGFIEGEYSTHFGDTAFAMKNCAELDIPMLIIDRGWDWDYGSETMTKYNNIAFQTRDPHYLFYIYTAPHYCPSIDALITIIDSLTDWNVSYTDFRAVWTGHSKFGQTCYVAAAYDDRIVGIMPSGASVLDAAAARLLGGVQGAAGTKPEAATDYKAVMMRYNLECLRTENQINSETFIVSTMGTDDDKDRSTGYTPKFIVDVSSSQLTHPHLLGSIANAPHTTATEIHTLYWQLTLSHAFFGREFSSVDTVWHLPSANGYTIFAEISSPNQIVNVRTWATSQSGLDTTSWNNFIQYPMTEQNGVYSCEIPANSTAYFVEVVDFNNDITGLATSPTIPVDADYPYIPVAPGAIENVQISAADNIDISWQNPENEDFAGTIILAKTDSYPENVLDGDIIYDGTGNSVVHNIDTSVNYYYAAFCYDTSGNYSQPLFFDKNYTDFQEKNISVNFDVYPNPANDFTIVKTNEQLGKNQDIAIYNYNGEKIKTLYSGTVSQSQSFVWKLNDNKGAKVTGGVYFCVIKSETGVFSKKIIIQ